MKRHDYQLRQLIREIKLSPSLKKNNPPIDNPFDNNNVKDIAKRFELAFVQALSVDLTVRVFDEAYNEKTREFDDGVYEKIESIVRDARVFVKQVLYQGARTSWNQANSSLNSTIKKAA